MTMKSDSRESDRKMNILYAGSKRSPHPVLWIIQVLLAIVFLFAGTSKLIMSIEEMTKQIQMPGLFLRFIGVCEILGALGLILPGLLRIRPELTPLAAAAGLTIITAGATVVGLRKKSIQSLQGLKPLKRTEPLCRG
jgi:uncharacterized membrane protein YphA (DoxX/SURF4 family)